MLEYINMSDDMTNTNCIWTNILHVGVLAGWTDTYNLYY